MGEEITCSFIIEIENTMMDTQDDGWRKEYMQEESLKIFDQKGGTIAWKVKIYNPIANKIYQGWLDVVGLTR